MLKRRTKCEMLMSSKFRLQKPLWQRGIWSPRGTILGKHCGFDVHGSCHLSSLQARRVESKDAGTEMFFYSLPMKHSSTEDMYLPSPVSMKPECPQGEA